MPYLKIQTNLPLTRRARKTVMREASAVVSQELEKPEDFVMIALEPDVPMLFAGSDEPVAFLELKAVGLPAKKTRALSGILCDLVSGHLGIPPERIYVKFIDVRRGMWGWRGDTF